MVAALGSTSVHCIFNRESCLSRYSFCMGHSVFHVAKSRQLFPFLALSLSVVLLLVFIKDLGNAAIISVLMLVICWYLSDKLTLTAGLLTAGISLGTIALHFRPALRNRFNSFQALASGSGQQYDGLPRHPPQWSAWKWFSRGKRVLTAPHA